MNDRKVGRVGIGTLAALFVLGASASHAQPLRTDLGAYFILGMKSVSVKNMRVLSACNVGVNCAQPTTNSKCGVLSAENAFFEDGSQIVGDKGNFNKPGADAWQAFLNKGGPFPNLNVRQPPIQSWVPPIIAGSCDAACNVDLSVIEAACGFPSPFPACAPGAPVVAPAGGDCVGAVDQMPGNGRCDLGPGTYGDVNVRRNASAVLTGGTYNVCSFTVGRSGMVTSGAAVVMNVDGAGPQVRVSNDARFGEQCGDFTVRIKGTGIMALGRRVRFAAKVCAPASELNLGDSNDLLGQFIGDTVNSNSDNDGRCCGGCTCFDAFSPTSAKVGDTITLTSQCDLTNATRILICGVEAPIVTQSSTTITATVPALAPQLCDVSVESTTGVYTHFGQLTILP